MGGPSAKVCSSAKCCVLAFKASMLYLGGSIGQSRFICQVLCTGIQGSYALFVGGLHWPTKVHLPSIVYRYSRQLFSLEFKATSLASRQGSPSAIEGSSAKFELTCCFMLCFTEGLFILHTKDLINFLSIFGASLRKLKSFTCIQLFSLTWLVHGSIYQW